MILSRPISCSLTISFGLRWPSLCAHAPKASARALKRTASTSAFRQDDDARIERVAKNLARRKNLPTVTEDEEKAQGHHLGDIDEDGADEEQMQDAADAANAAEEDADEASASMSNVPSANGQLTFGSRLGKQT